MTRRRGALPDLSAARSVREADVWKGDRLAARLRRTDAGVVFEYTDDYLADPGPAVATTLPVTDEPVRTTAGAVPPFFAGLLPEGRRLSSLRRAVKTSADDDLSLLVAVGADPVGDVRVLPSGTTPAAQQPLVQVQHAWDEVRFADLLEDAGVQDPAALPGVQDKASARMIAVPVAKAGLRYILKVDPPEYPHVVENEAYFLDLARRARFPVVSAEVVHDADGRAGLLVERFDRVPDPMTGASRAVAVEDGAQVLGLYPSAKYDVTTERLVTALADLCPARVVAVRDLYRQVLVAWLTGNGDLHAKNASVLDRDGEWRVAPAYDLPSTLPYGDRTQALSVRGRITGLSRRLLLELGDAVGLPARAAERTLDEVLAATEPVAAEWRDGGRSPFAARETADVLRVLRHRRRAAST